jgi:DNA-binding transcriptional regulator YiaG
VAFPSITASAPALAPQQIKQIRLRLHLSQLQLAERLHVHRITVVRWEMGRGRPIPSMVVALRRLGNIEAVSS